MTDKLAEEILNKMVDGFVPYFSESEVIEAMQAYHEAKMKEVTDEDIKAYAEKEFGTDYTDNDVKESWIEGAKAMRDGEIKHNREV